MACETCENFVCTALKGLRRDHQAGCKCPCHVPDELDGKPNLEALEGMAIESVRHVINDNEVDHIFEIVLDDGSIIEFSYERGEGSVYVRGQIL
ncbi:MAG: hypothetical protein ACXABY_00730 [Candidatus Thorarchaeota archaeon]|jgi:hypothetical protein